VIARMGRFSGIRPGGVQVSLKSRERRFSSASSDELAGDVPWGDHGANLGDGRSV